LKYTALALLGTLRFVICPLVKRAFKANDMQEIDLGSTRFACSLLNESVGCSDYTVSGEWIRDNIELRKDV
jgi:hypothetical protein